METTCEISAAAKRKKVPIAKIVTYFVLVLYTVFLFFSFL